MTNHPTAHLDDPFAAETRIYLQHGWLTFQAARLARTDRWHWQKLLALSGLKNPKVVIDMGAGVGDLAAYWRRSLPDTTIYGVTTSRLQADIMARRGDSTPLLTDYHETPLWDKTADAVIFLESFGYSTRPRELLREARRLLRPGGILMVKDYLVHDNPLDPAWNYTHRTPSFALDLLSVGFVLERQQRLIADTASFERLWASSALASLHPPEKARPYNHDIFPVLWVATKPA